MEFLLVAAVVVAVGLGVWVHNVGLKNVETRLSAKIDNLKK